MRRHLNGKRWDARSLARRAASFAILASVRGVTAVTRACSTLCFQVSGMICPCREFKQGRDFQGGLVRKILLFFSLFFTLTALEALGQYISVPSKSGPMASDIDPDANLLVVANRDANTISIIDLTNNQIRKTLAVGTTPTSVAINPRTHQAVVTNFGSDDISIINLESDEVVDTIPVGNSPRAVAIDVNNNRALVANLNDNSLSLINLSTGGDLLPTPIQVGSFPIAVAYNSVNNTGLIANYQDGTVSVVKLDKDNEKKIGDVLVGLKPVAIAVCPEINRGVVVNQDSNTISVLQLSDYTVVATVAVGSRPFGAAINPRTKMAAVVSNGDQLISLVYLGDGFYSDTVHDPNEADHRNTKISTLIQNVGSNPIHISINSNNNTALVCNITDDKISVISLDFTASVPFAFDTADFRSNLVLTNLGWEDATIELTLYDKDDNLLGLGEVKLQANEFRQLNNINRILTGSSAISNTLGVLRITSNQPYSSQLSLIDNHTNDPAMTVGRSSGSIHWLFNSLPNTSSYQARLVIWNPGNTSTTAKLVLKNSLGAVLATQDSASISAKGFYYSENILSDLGSISQVGSLDVSTAYYPIIPLVYLQSTQHTGGFLEAQLLN